MANENTPATPATPSNTPPANPAGNPGDAAPSSADVLTSRQADHARKMEIRLSALEDDNKAIREENKTLRAIVEKVGKIPAPGIPGESVLDTVCDLLGLSK